MLLLLTITAIRLLSILKYGKRVVNLYNIVKVVVSEVLQSFETLSLKEPLFLLFFSELSCLCNC